MANSTRQKILRKYRDQMIVHIVVYIMLLSISNCCAAINIHLFIYFYLIQYYLTCVPAAFQSYKNSLHIILISFKLSLGIYTLIRKHLLY
jgi:hypothetical protein